METSFGVRTGDSSMLSTAPSTKIASSRSGWLIADAAAGRGCCVTGTLVVRLRSRLSAAVESSPAAAVLRTREQEFSTEGKDPSAITRSCLIPSAGLKCAAVVLALFVEAVASQVLTCDCSSGALLEIAGLDAEEEDPCDENRRAWRTTGSIMKVLKMPLMRAAWNRKKCI